MIHDNDGFRLSETTAIFHYLGRKNIIPYPDAKAVAQIDEFLSWNQSSLFITMGKLFLETWVKPFRNIHLPPHGQMINVTNPTSFVTLDQSLNDLENIWLKDKFITGDKITFADIIAACEIMQVVGFKLYELDKDKHANIIRWLNDIRMMTPEFDKTHEIVYKFGNRFPSGPPHYIILFANLIQQWKKIKKLIK